jgi:hypothetical protein
VSVCLSHQVSPKRRDIEKKLVKPKKKILLERWPQKNYWCCCYGFESKPTHFLITSSVRKHPDRDSYWNFATMREKTLSSAVDTIWGTQSYILHLLRYGGNPKLSSAFARTRGNPRLFFTVARYWGKSKISSAVVGILVKPQTTFCCC